MPIKFRCPHCRQFLGISRAKAGEIADCPMCGKTLRVPDLDGTVRPLPAPELNLEDPDLVDALGELAGIGAQQRSDAAKARAVQQSGLTAAQEAPVAPLPQPVELEPLQPAVPIVVADSPGPARRSSGRGTSAPAALRTAASVSPDDATTGGPVAQASGVQSKRTVRPHQPDSRRSTTLWAAAAAVGALVLLGGTAVFLMNRNVAAPAAAAEEAAQPGAPQAAEVRNGLEPAAGKAAALTGRITYVSEAGDTRADEGARVIVLPEQRGGTIKFDAAGFMAGSGDVDVAVATAALRALGGDLAVADEKGEYKATLDDAGSYQLLIISRHQSRPWEVAVEAPAQQMLERFFIRPSTLLGQLAYEVQPFQYRGQGTSPKDFAFERR